MEPSLIITGAMTLLKPLLEKAGEKAAETIGEKLVNKAVEKSFWQKVESLFIIEDEKTDEPKEIKDIANKSIATSSEVAKIEAKFSHAINTNPQFAAEVQSDFGLSHSDKFIAEQLLISIAADKEKLTEYLEERRLASIETEGSYDIMIARTQRRMKKDENTFIKLVTGK